MQASLFDSARLIPAADIARREGIPLRRKGAKEWACCPLHGEKTPSMCFYPDGRWYCFGCHQHGDGIDLYAAVHSVSTAEAARVLAGLDSMPRRKPPPQRPKHPAFLREPDEDGLTWDKLCSIRHAAVAVIQETDNDPDNPRLWTAIAAKSAAEERLDNLWEGALWAALNNS